MAQKVTLKQFKKWVRNSDTELAKELKASIAKHTAECCGLAKEWCPVDTGYLQRSIDYRIEDGGTVGTVYATAYYARIVERGNSTHHAQPYMIPAWNVTKQKYVADCERILEEFLKKGW